MKHKLRRIMQDITSLDPALKGRQTEELVRLFLKAKPDAEMNRRFQRTLRTRLLGGEREPGKLSLIFRQVSGFFAWLFDRRLQLAAAASVLSVLLIATVAFLPLLVTFQQKSTAAAAPGLSMEPRTITGQPGGNKEREPALLPAPEPTAGEPMRREDTMDKKKQARAEKPLKAVETPKMNEYRLDTTSAEESTQIRDITAPSVDELKSTGEFKDTEKAESLSKEGSPGERALPDKTERPAEKGFLPATGFEFSSLYSEENASSYQEIRSYLDRGIMPPPEAVRIRELINYFPYNYNRPSGDLPFTVFTELAQCPWNPAHKLLYVGIRSAGPTTPGSPPLNMVFILNTSASMNRPGKLPVLKQAIRPLAGRLGAGDRISIISYAGRATLVLPPAGAGQYNAILQAVDTLQAGGGIADDTGLEQAYNLAMGLFRANSANRVILATDGDLSLADRFTAAGRGNNSSVTILDFGPRNRSSLGLVESGGATGLTYAFIDSFDAAQQALFSQLAGVRCAVQTRFNPDRVRSYRLLGDGGRQAETSGPPGLMTTAETAAADGEFTVLYEIVPAQPGSRASSPEVVTIRVVLQEQSVDAAVVDSDTPYASASAGFRLAAAAAEWGLLLTDSDYKGNATYEQVLGLARDAAVLDSGNTRSEFLRLVRISQELSGKP
jgi:Ca-activated chloride channel family protein